jgi:hypothetical protein
MKESATAWTLVCSQSRARVLRASGPVRVPRAAELVLRAREEHLRAGVLGLRGGAAAVSAPPVPPTSPGEWLRADERAFAAEIATLLDAHRCAGDFDRLAAIGPAPMLALLRERYPPGLRRVVVAEWERDLIGLDTDALHRAVARLWRLAGEG